MPTKSAVLALLLPLVGALAACSSDPAPSVTAPKADGGASGCATYVVPAATDLTKPTVSFGTEVLPLLQRSCGLSSSCHATRQPPVIGGKPNPIDAKTVRAALVGKPSEVLATMSYVSAGDPTTSFLLRKMDGDQCMLDAQCAGGGCGVSMPQGSDALPVDSRDLVRRWIAQGALDN